MGMEAVNWNKQVSLITMETEGSNCFNEAIKRGKIVTLKAINSIAKSLGALSVSTKLFEMSQMSHMYTIKSQIVTDKQALESCLRFSKDHRMLVEPACGSALAAVYFKPEIFETISKKPIIVIVCGGNMATIELFETWKNSLK